MYGLEFRDSAEVSRFLSRSVLNALALLVHRE